MTLNLLIDTFSLSLEHISSILTVVERELTPKYPLGLKVRYVYDTGSYKVIYFGEIFGFEYFPELELPSSGWSYGLDIKFSHFLFNDGTEDFRCYDSEFLMVEESDIQEFTMESFGTFDWKLPLLKWHSQDPICNFC